jgi:DNA uptake protein ComE-like DNA-binding protein
MNRLTAVLSVAAVVAVAACAKKSDNIVDTTAAGTTVDTSMAASTTTTATPPAATSTTSAGSTSAIVPININTATDAQILAIPGMGPRMLREFKEYRPYTSIEQFRREIGKYVDKAEVARLEQYITIK